MPLFSQTLIPKFSTHLYGLIKEVKSLICKQCKVAYNIHKPMKDKTWVWKDRGKSPIFFRSLPMKVLAKVMDMYVIYN